MLGFESSFSVVECMQCVCVGERECNFYYYDLE